MDELSKNTPNTSANARAFAADVSVDYLVPSVAVCAAVQSAGDYPARDRDGMTELAYIGEIRHFAGVPHALPGTSTNGQLLPIPQNTALFSVAGTVFGGDGKSNFSLPDLRGRTMLGTGQGIGLAEQVLGVPFGKTPPCLPLTYVILTQGIYPAADGREFGAHFTGQVVGFAGNYAPGGYKVADGSLLPIQENSELFELIGNTYGGDGVTTFALPDLRGRAVIGAGRGPDTTEWSLGQQAGVTNDNPAFKNSPPTLALNYLIAVQGTFPSPDGGMQGETYLGELTAFAGNFAPGGWALANGQMMRIADNQALYALLGTTFGGDGITTFALPDLRGRCVIGISEADAWGSTRG